MTTLPANLFLEGLNLAVVKDFIRNGNNLKLHKVVPWVLLYKSHNVGKNLGFTKSIVKSFLLELNHSEYELNSVKPLLAKWDELLISDRGSNHWSLVVVLEDGLDLFNLSEKNINQDLSLCGNRVGVAGFILSSFIVTVLLNNVVIFIMVVFVSICLLLLFLLSLDVVQDDLIKNGKTGALAILSAFLHSSKGKINNLLKVLLLANDIVELLYLKHVLDDG